MENGQGSVATSAATQVLEGAILGGAPLATVSSPSGQQVVPPKPPRPPVPLIPNTMEDVYRMADSLIDCQLIPERWMKGCIVDGKLDKHRLRGNLIFALATGIEIGMSPFQSLRELYMVHGHVSESVLSKKARVQASGLCEHFTFVESTEDRCIVEVKRVGAPLRRHEYTIEDAKKAGLLGGRDPKGDGNWAKRAKLMLRRRAEGEVLDEEFADVLKGLARLEDMEEELAAEVLAKQPVPTVAPPAPAGALRRVDKETTRTARTHRPEAAASIPTLVPTSSPQSASEPVLPGPEDSPPPSASPASPEPHASASAPEEVSPEGPKGERMKDNPDWDNEAKSLITRLRATKTMGELDKVAAEVRGYTGPWRQDVGRAMSDHRGYLRGGRG